MILKKPIVWFEEVNKEDVSIVGGKGANLGEMTNARLPIPYGFIVTSEAYYQFIKKSKLENRIKETLSTINYEDPSQLHQVSKHLHEMILQSPIPTDLSEQIIKYYEDLNLKEDKFYNVNLTAWHQTKRKVKHLYDSPLVAVRSSATAEDLPNASFAGQQETYLNVRGESHLLTKVKECWASLFTERAIYYRHEQGFDHFKVGLAAVVQRMVQSEKSGIAFSIDPVTNNKTKIIIEAIFGLGEYIVQGKVTPDHYEVDKRSLLLLKKEIKYQSLKYIKSNISNKEISLNKKDGSQQKLTEEEITKVALLVKDIENHYFFPQDIEWAIENDRVFIVQSRPITTIKNQELRIKKQEDEAIILNSELLILSGSPASPGIAVGPVKIITSPTEIGKICKGDVLVAPQTNPDYVPAMKKAVAIITERGGRTSHAAIVSRELGVPAVVGAENATKKLHTGMIVTVNGITGEIFKGKVIDNSVKKETHHHTHYKTLTKIYVNLAEPEEALKISKLDVDGIGLLRAEFMIAGIGIHPKEFIRNKKESVFINTLSSKLLNFVRPFNPRPIIYRATDFKTNEYRHLTGGAKFEPKEENPMLGFRGAARYIVNPDIFMMELKAIKNIWEKGFRNLHLMIPFIRSPWELIKIKEIIENSGLFAFHEFKLLIMVEVPACALNIEEFLKIGVDGISIGTNDLTMMLLGVDRDNEEVANLYDERTPIVESVLEFVVKTAKNYGVTSSICGQAASDYPELVEKLVKSGITSVSINPDAIERTRELIYNIEKKH